MKTKPLLLLTLSLLTIAGIALSNLRPVAAAPVWTVSLDANSTSQTDIINSTDPSPVKSFRIGAIVNATATSPISNVYSWQFTIGYNASAFIPQGDPSAASLYPDGAANTVLFGAQTTAGTANWAGLIQANNAFGSSTISSAGSTGQITVFITLLSPAPAVTISAKNLLANLQFEFLNKTTTTQLFTITNVIFTDNSAIIIPGISSGTGATETVANAPPVAHFTHTAPPTVGPVKITFDASGSSDSDGTITNATGYFWDFGDGTQDLGVTGKVLDHTYAVAGQYNVTLRVVDDLGATGAARDSLGNVVANSQKSHIFETLKFLPFTISTNTSSSFPYQPGGAVRVLISFTSIGGFAGKINVTAAISPSINGASPPTITNSTVELKRITSTIVSCSPESFFVDGMTTCAATVTDNSPGTSSTPTGFVSFAQVGVSGSFTGNPCSLIESVPGKSSCSATFSASTAGLATIASVYGGDSNHSGSIGSTTARPRHPTSTSLSCGPSSVAVGQNTTCTVIVTDTFATPTPLIGAVAFSNSSAGLFFSSITGVLLMHPTCAVLVSQGTNTCSVIYQPTELGTGTDTITGRYTSDPTHSNSTGSFDLIVTLGSASIATALLCPPTNAVASGTTCTSPVISAGLGASPSIGTVTSASDIQSEGSNSSLVIVAFPMTTPLLSYTLTVNATSEFGSTSIYITLLPTTLRIDPALVTGVAKGGTFTANVTASVARAISWQFTLRYDPALLSTSFRKVSFGPFWQNALTSNRGFPVINLNQTSGTLTVAFTLQAQGSQPITPFTGNGTLVSVLFTVNSYDNSSLHLLAGSLFVDVDQHNIPVSIQRDGLFDNRLPHDVAITSVAVLPTTVNAGSSVTITVVVKNKGLTSETMNVAVTNGGNSIGQQQVSLNPGELKTLSFTWVTPSSTSGTITLQAQATISTGDGDGSDNTLSNTVKVNAQPVVNTPGLPPYLLYGGAGAAAAIAAIVAVLFLRRRKTSSLTL